MMRINKYISETGYCSRREVDKLIQSRKVTINGKVAELGSIVEEDDDVRINGRPIGEKKDLYYIALNKPVGITSTTERGVKGNIVDFVGHRERIFPIGRLDKDSEGLILMTNDGDIVNEILRAENAHEKEYMVTVDKPIISKLIHGIERGVRILGTKTLPCIVNRINERTFRIILTQGLNRQIRRMCEVFGYDVSRLKRVRVMNIELGDLEVGEWRDLTEDELDELFDTLDYEPSGRVSKSPPPLPDNTVQAQTPKTSGRSGGPRALQGRDGKPLQKRGANRQPGARGAEGKPSFEQRESQQPGRGRTTGGKPTFGKPKFGKPGVGKPDYGRDAEGKSDYGRGGAGKSDYGRGGAGKSDYGRGGAGKSDYGRGGAGKSDYGRGGAGKSDYGKGGAGKSDYGKGGAGKSDYGKGGAGKSDYGKGGAGKSDYGKGGAGKSDYGKGGAGKSDYGKGGAGKSDYGRGGAGKSDYGKGGAGKSDYGKGGAGKSDYGRGGAGGGGNRSERPVAAGGGNKSRGGTGGPKNNRGRGR